MIAKLSSELRRKNRRLGLFLGFLALWPISIPLVLIVPPILLFVLPYKEYSQEEAVRVGESALIDELSDKCSLEFKIIPSNAIRSAHEDFSFQTYFHEIVYDVSVNSYSGKLNTTVKVSVYGELNYILISFPDIHIHSELPDC